MHGRSGAPPSTPKVDKFEALSAIEAERPAADEQKDHASLAWPAARGDD